MGRPSKLTDRQKAEIGRRLAQGESGRKLAREFKCSEATIRANVSAQVATIQDVAGRLADAERDLERLPVSAQVSARTLADQLNGDLIVYNNLTGIFTVDGNPSNASAANPGGRVRAILAPRNAASAPVAPAAAASAPGLRSSTVLGGERK